MTKVFDSDIFNLAPIAMWIEDFSGVKALFDANDQLGHDAGDGLLRRFGEILNGAVSAPNHACRIGGDEFAVLLPGSDAKAANTMIETIGELLSINNQFYSNAPLSIAVGVATSETGETMESVVKRADALMYEDKKSHYATANVSSGVTQTKTPTR
jgi:diguanylate cyclase (GGDEF)-like protein